MDGSMSDPLRITVFSRAKSEETRAELSQIARSLDRSILSPKRDMTSAF
jgi:hypothetical protein